jgi:hypothetical protein
MFRTIWIALLIITPLSCRHLTTGFTFSAEIDSLCPANSPDLRQCRVACSDNSSQQRARIGHSPISRDDLVYSVKC